MCLGIQCQIWRVAGSLLTDNGNVCGGAIYGHAELSGRSDRGDVISSRLQIRVSGGGEVKER